MRLYIISTNNASNKCNNVPTKLTNPFRIFTKLFIIRKAAQTIKYYLLI